MSHQVFISYSQNDIAVAQAVCAALEQNQVPCWIAPRNISPGQDWPSAITQAIHNSKCFVLVFSTRSNTSIEVQREVQLAIESLVPILPFRIEDFQLSPKLQYYLSSVQWLKAFPPPSDQYLSQLIVTTRHILGLLEVANEPTIAAVTQPAPPSSIFQALPKNNLPLQLTSFIGREKDIKQVKELLSQHRLVTLTGVGGSGKTRLALQVAAGLLDAFPDGVRLVELAPLADSSLIPQTVIAALGQLEQPGKSPNTFLADYLREKNLLLILDNCEHLVKACAALAADLLHSSPHLTILATSREILGVDGEVPFHIPPLEIPDSTHLPSLKEMASIEAVQLLIERALVVSPGFSLTQDNAAAVAQITQRLDGIPLAIELAAARLRMLSVGQIALRLNDTFRLLTGGSRIALPRHQTLQALIDWSYNLLSESEHILLCNLSVFAGGWTLEAAEEICAGEQVDVQDVLDLLGSLADKSLILVAPIPGGEMRYRMLETIRQYAHTRLVDAGEVTAVRARHLTYYLQLAETLEPKLRGREQIQTLDYIGNELDNLRLAQEWALQTDVAAELRLAASLHWFWDIRYHWAEGISWLEQGLAAEAFIRGGHPLEGTWAVICAKALAVLGSYQIDQEKAKDTLEEALALYRGSGSENRLGLAWAQLWLGECISYGNENPELARALIDEALNLFRETGDPHGIAESLEAMGNFEIDPTQRKKIHLEQLTIYKANGDTEGIAKALFYIQLSDFIEGDYKSVIAVCEASRENYQRVGNPYWIAVIERRLAMASLLNGNLERSILSLEEALVDHREMADAGEIAWCLFWKGMIAFSQGHYDQVAELSKETELIAQKTGDPETISNVHYLRARLARLRGDAEEARRCAREGLNAGPKLEYAKIRALLELGHLAMQDGDLEQAGAVLHEGLKDLIDRRFLNWTGLPLDGLAVLAVREGKLERAARLFGTRLWRGWAHTLSPIERAEREADFAELKVAMGEVRFDQLREEGYAMTFMQVMALAQEEGSSQTIGYLCNK